MNYNKIIPELSVTNLNNWYRQNNKLLGNKEFLVMDPDGYLLRFSEDLREKNL